jgi:hypothetical protein
MDRRWKPNYPEDLARKSWRHGQGSETDIGHRHLIASSGSKNMITSVVAVALVLACALYLAGTVGAAETRVEAETMTLSGRMVMVERDPAASGDKRVAFYTNGSATKGFNGQLNQIQLRAKAKPCDGNPVLDVFVDGVKKGTATVSSKAYADYSVPVSGMADGAHVLEVSYPNDYGTEQCNRDVFLDYYVPSQSYAPPPTSDLLKWAPPTLANPTVIHVSGSGQQTINLDNTRDYVIDMPDGVYRGALTINGGRNVTMIGGHIQNPNTITDSGNWNTRTLYIRRYTSPQGSVFHAEGLLIERPPDVPRATFDAIAVSAPQSTVQLENIRATGIQGSSSLLHADLIHNQGGVGELRVDKFTGTSSYQGFQLGTPGTDAGANIWRISRSDLALFNSSVYSNHDWGRLLWLSDGTNTCTTIASQVELDQIYLKGRLQSTGRTQRFHETTMPTSSLNSSLPCASRLSGSYSTWTAEYPAGSVGAPVTGLIRDKNALASEFVPAGVAGANYLSPGYQ